MYFKVYLTPHVRTIHFFFFRFRIVAYYARVITTDPIQDRAGTLNPPRSTEMRIHLALRPTALFPARLRYF